MASLSASNYLVRQPIERALARITAELPPRANVYDLGCGQKPYAHFFAPHTYTSVDTDRASAADLYYDGRHIPLSAASADLILCTQTLQHSEDPRQLMSEIYRLLAPGGRAIVTVPFGIKMVAEPYQKNGMLWRDDYWRFTKYGLLQLTEQFEVVSLTEATGYLGTLLQLVNYAIASLRLGGWVTPFYILTNSLAVLLDRGVEYIAPYLPRGQFFYDAVYQSFTSNYIAILQKP